MYKKYLIKLNVDNVDNFVDKYKQIVDNFTNKFMNKIYKLGKIWGKYRKDGRKWKVGRSV